MASATITKHIRQLIIDNQMGKALAQLRTLLAHSPKLNQVLVQSARHQELVEKIRMKIIPLQLADEQKSQLRFSLFQLLSEIEQETHPEQSPELATEATQAATALKQIHSIVDNSISAGRDVNIGNKTIHTESKTSQGLRLWLYFLVPVLAVGTAYLAYNYQVLQQDLQLKVRLHNQTPNPHLAEPIGRLTLSYGTNIVPKAQVQGEVLFEGIPASYKNKTVRLSYQANGFVPVDTTFTLQDPLLVLHVRRNDDLALLKGKITTINNAPLADVKASIPCCSTKTDQTGAFTLHIPPEHQRNRQRIDLFKTGYQSKSIEEPVVKGSLFRDYLQKLD